MRLATSDLVAFRRQLGSSTTVFIHVEVECVATVGGLDAAVAVDPVDRVISFPPWAGAPPPGA